MTTAMNRFMESEEELQRWVYDEKDNYVRSYAAPNYKYLENKPL